MSWREVIDVIKMLAQSQGFYGRLLRSIEEQYEEDYDNWEAFMQYLEEQKFRDTLDVVMFFET